jgi:protease-4
MKRFLLTVAAVFAGLLLFFVGTPLLVLVIAASAVRPEPTPDRAVLTLDLRRGLSDQTSPDPLSGFGSPSTSVLEVVDALGRAQSDERIRGLLIRLPEGGLAPAAADELRLAVRRFKTSGKPVIAHSQGIYPSGASVSTYMLGAATGDFWMQPASSLQSVGMSSEEIFFKRFFDRYGVEPDFQQRAEYKNAVNPFLYDDYTPAHREATRSWMTSVYQSALGAAAQDRRMPLPKLQAAIEAGPYDAEDARKAGLIDRVDDIHAAEAALLIKAGDKAKLLEFDDYDVPSRRSGPVIAVIGGEGAIVTGSSGNQAFGQGGAVYSDDVAKAFFDAAKDDSIKAIVFRVSSPGGSDTASEQIRTALRAAKVAGKPVVVSMGTYAASGGYWVSMDATRIVALPSTLTGSIGVFGGKFALGEALGRYGIDVRSQTVGGGYADAFDMGDTFTPEQRARFAGWMDRIYANFITRVSVARRLPVERVQTIARGRVWTGEQAKALGLVDELGGFHEALAAAKQLAGIEADAEVRLRRLPARRSPLELLQQALGVSAQGARVLAAAAWVMGDPRSNALLEQAMRARLGVQGSTVLAPTPIR